MEYTLKELLDIPRLWQLLDTIDEIHSMPSAIVDIDGNILTATAWQDISTKFHRINPETEKMCIESDTHIGVELDKEMPHAVYRCPMGLVDAAAPIIIEGKHLGNVLTGQFFLEAPDEAQFIEQAQRYGFDEAEYLAAMRNVPLFPEEKLHKNLAFMHSLTLMLAEQGLNNKRTLEAAEILRKSEERHRTILQTTMDGVWTIDMQGRFVEVNAPYCRMSGYSTQELLSLNISDLDANEKPEGTHSRIEYIRQHSTALFEACHRRKDGSLFDVEVSAQFFPGEGGQIIAFIRDISERKRTDVANIRSMLRQRAILDNLPMMAWLKDTEGRLEMVNEPFAKAAGLSIEQCIGKTDIEIWPDKKMAKSYMDDDYDICVSGKKKLVEEPINTPDGVKWHFTYKTPLFDENCQVIGTAGIAKDITANKQAEMALVAASHLLQTIIETVPMRIFWKDADLRYLGCNTLFTNDAGATRPDELIGKDDFQLVWQDQAEQYRADDRLVMESGIPKLSFDEQQTTPNGDIIWLRTSKVPLRNKEDKVFAVLGVYEDITERKQMEIALIRSEQSLRTIIKASPVPLAINDSRGNITFVNDTFLQAVGYTLNEIPTLEEWWHHAYPDPEYRQTVSDTWMKNLEKAKRTNSAFTPMEANIMCKDGAIRTFICSSASIEGGFEGNNLVVLVDITARKNAEDALKRSEANLSATLDATADGILAVDGNGKVIFYNKKFVELWNIPPSIQSAIEDDTLLEFVLTNLLNPDAFLAEVKRLYNSHESSFDIIHFKDGRIFERYSFSLYQNNTPLTGRVWSFRDITDRKKAEEEKQEFEQQLQHTQKLESLGVLSGGIAHDFNNILAIIMGYCSLTKMDYETAEQNIQEIEKAAERAAALCRQMLAYAGKAQLTKSQVNMWTMVDEMVTMLKATLPQNAVVKPELSARIPTIEGDASQLRQVVMNLIINAAEAIGTKQGEIKVSLSKETVQAGHPEKDLFGKEIAQGRYVCLEVTDDGCGMNEETKWRIFEPFYTTKFTGRGLGMSAVLGIINSHYGALQLFSKLGQGTTFKVYLPITASDSTGEEDLFPYTPAVQWQGSGTVLLVEDEYQIRFIAKIMLQRSGFTVLEAVNGKEALELYHKNSAEIRVVLTDMGMPVMDGYALLPALKQFNPGLPIIISSGFGDADVISRIGRDNIAGIISKPYNFSQLMEILKMVLEDETTTVE